MQYRYLLIPFVCLLWGCNQAPAKPVALTKLAPKETLTVTLPDLPASRAIPDRFSNYGANEIPKIQWSPTPAGTQSFLLLIEDPDAPGDKPFVHYLVFNIPPTETSLSPTIPPMATVGRNSYGDTTYLGPRPPSGTHRYHFQVFALSRVVTEDKNATWEMIFPKIQDNVLAGGEVVATYRRQ